MELIKQKLSLLPMKPGCYLMKNNSGIIIYVGKAKNLKKRVSSYFNKVHTGKTAKLVSEITDFEYIVVNSEIESLILEQNLIKKYDPKYNILLRDDKSYPYIELTNEEIPRLLIVRNINKKKNKDLYGPYPNVIAARKTVNLLNRIYPLRKCKNMPKKPCLYYHIGECLGYCTNNVDKKLIDEMKKDIILFLKGDYKKVTSKLESDMIKESEKLNFEKAKEYKDLLNYIKIVLTKQQVEISNTLDLDVFGHTIYKGYLSIQVLFIRNGKIIERHFKIMPIIGEVEEIFTTYIANFYNKFLLPKEIIVDSIVDKELLEDYLKVKVINPIKGDKKNILELANNNALINIENEFEIIEKDENRTFKANEELRNILKLDKLNRIELFDNSHLFGTYSVSGMVVFKNGLPSKNDYRKYKIKIDTNDEYGMMREVIYRRYFKVLMENLERPDLIIVDGGVGQINIAREILKELNLDIMVVGLKKNDKHATSSLLAFDPLKEVEIDKKSNLFYYLERMQNEVHNFTINYHKQIRSKGSLESILDNVKGIGNVRKKELIKKYKTITNMKKLEINELESILPSEVAKNLYNFLKNI